MPVTARPSTVATTSSPGTPLGDVAGLRDERPHAPGLGRSDYGGEGDQRADGFRRAAVEFLGVGGLHGRDLATLPAGASAIALHERARLMRGIRHVGC